jgi:hypothetical protein
MAVNNDKTHLWKTDVERSIDFYNDWFLRFAPDTFRSQRAETTARVAYALELTDYLRNVSPQTLRDNPGILPILRMICAPPLARERLVGLAHLNKNLMNVRIHRGQETVNIPIDCVIQPRAASSGDFPILIEAKSAGDVTNTNKRRKEEAQKYHRLTSEFGPSIKSVSF